MTKEEMILAEQLFQKVFDPSSVGFKVLRAAQVFCDIEEDLNIIKEAREVREACPAHQLAMHEAGRDYNKKAGPCLDRIMRRLGKYGT